MDPEPAPAEDTSNDEPQDNAEPAEGDEPGDTDAPTDQPASGEPTDEPPADDAEPPAPAEPGIDADLKPFLKQMSKQASAAVLKKLNAVKQEAATVAAERDALNEQVAQFQGKKLPDNWYADPEAYRAVPQYREAEQKFMEAQAATGDWGEKLSAYEAGEMVYDAATNTLVPHTGPEPATPNPRVRRMIEDKRMEAYKQQERFAAEANGIRENFANTYKQAEQHIVGNTEKLFPWVKDEKNPAHTYYKKVLEQFPKEFRGQASARLAAALGVRVLQLQVALQDRDKQIKAKNGVRDDARKNGPIPGRKARASTNPVDKEWKDEDLAGL